MKKSTILELIITTIFMLTCLNICAATLDDARAWFRSKMKSPYNILYNTYPDKHVWYTIYKHEGLTNSITAYGCLAPNSFRNVEIPSNREGYSYKVMIEVKDDARCGGGNICQTESTQFSEFKPGKTPEFVISHKNGNNCYISYDTYPDTSGKYWISDMAKTLFYANAQQGNFVQPEPSPLQLKTLSIQAAFYGQEGKPVWEINGIRIIDIINNQSYKKSLYIPANMSQFFGGDPMPNQAKIVAVQVLADGQLINLRQREGRPLMFPGVEGADYWTVKTASEPSPQQSNRLLIQAAFYGKEGQPTWEINGQKIVDIIIRNTTNGIIWIPPNMTQYFGGDPLPNQPKIVAVQIIDGGRVINLRQAEGKALQYPGVEGKDYWIVK